MSLQHSDNIFLDTHQYRPSGPTEWSIPRNENTRISRARGDAIPVTRTRTTNVEKLILRNKNDAI